MALCVTDSNMKFCFKKNSEVRPNSEFLVTVRGAEVPWRTENEQVWKESELSESGVRP